jgi:hypothetical protein
MIIQVKGEGAGSIRTAAKPIKLADHAEIDLSQPISTPGFNQHREAIPADLWRRAEPIHLRLRMKMNDCGSSALMAIGHRCFADADHYLGQHEHLHHHDR